MLEFGNKEFRNLQEQVGKNQEDIRTLKTGIKIERWLTETQLPEFIKEENVGKYFIVSRNATEHLYLITKRANGGLLANDLGEWPNKIPGEQGPRGEQGERGIRGLGIFGVSSQLPSATAYWEGDMFLLANGELYKKVNGEWLLQTTLKGPQGVQGYPGDSVTPNPIDNPTDALSKIKINGVTYSIGISQEYRTLLDGLLNNVAIDGENVQFGHNVEIDGRLLIHNVEDIVNDEGEQIAQGILSDSDDIVVYTDDTLHLANGIKNEITRSLKIPVASPSSKELAGVNTSKEQIRITQGSGIDINENNVLNVIDRAKTYTGNVDILTEEQIDLFKGGCFVNGDVTVYDLTDNAHTLRNPLVYLDPDSMGGWVNGMDTTTLHYIVFQIGSYTGTDHKMRGVYTDLSSSGGGSFVKILSKTSLNTLTDEEYNMFAGGVFVNGTINNKINPIFMPFGADVTGGLKAGIYISGSSGTGSGEIGTYRIQVASPHKVTFNDTIISRSFPVNRITANFDYCNGKKIPSYPSDTGTFVLKCVNGTLTWVAE